MTSTMASPRLIPHESQSRSRPSHSLSQGPAFYRSRDFRDFVNNRGRSEQGYNWRWESASFITHSTLVGYWHDNGIEPSPGDRTQLHNLKDLEGYESVFSILVFIGKAEFINEFMQHAWTDIRLPMEDGHPFGLNSPPTTLEMVEQFREHQWQFCPLPFPEQPRMKGRKLDPRQILPIKSMEILFKSPCSDARTTVRKIIFHEGFTGLSSDSTVVFKEYDVQDNETHRNSWEREQRVYSSIGSHKYIAKFLGSFEHEHRCVVILEYANGGSLQNLFRRQDKPGNLEEVRLFWRALMRLALGIHHLHHIKPLDDNNGRVGCAHRDIKPSNILVFHDPHGLYSENFALKLADFNTSTDLQPVSPNGTGPQDNDGNRTYRSPEASGINEFEEGDWREVPLVSDIWSLGCVLSEAFVWLGKGERGLDAYETQRKSILSVSPHFPNSGYDACFHDGENVLPCVRAAHEDALPCLPAFDDFSPKILDLIENWMLVQSDGRLEARQLWAGFEKILHHHAHQAPTVSLNLTTTRNPGITLTSTDHSVGLLPLNRTEITPKDSFGTTPGIPRSNSRPVAPPINPHRPQTTTGSCLNPAHSSITQGNNSPRDKEHNCITLQKPPPRTSSTYTERPVQPNSARSLVRQLQYPVVPVDRVIKIQDKREKREILEGFVRFVADIGKRHFIFVIDESETMKDHAKNVIDIVKASEWLLKDIETSTIEFRFTSDPRRQYFQTRSIRRQIMKITGFGKPKNVIQLIEQRLNASKDHFCNMESCLNSIFSDEVVRTGCQTSVFVLTDGIWQYRARSPGGNVEKSINTLVEKMKKLNMTRTDFCIQFVRFGDDKVGTDRLVYLDDMAKDNKGGMEDIVDHKSHTESIWPILIGAVSDAIDNDGDDDENDNQFDNDSGKRES